MKPKKHIFKATILDAGGGGAFVDCRPRRSASQKSPSSAFALLCLQTLKPFYQIGNLCLDHIPDDLIVQAKVFVCDDVS